jgi:NADH:ubiquinone oxidoreductase subunit H
MIGAIRCCLLTLNLEIFMGLMILNVTALSGSYSFLPVVVLQEII